MSPLSKSYNMKNYFLRDKMAPRVRPTYTCHESDFMVFCGSENEDVNEFFKTFVRSCIMQGDRTEDSWCSLIGYFLENEALEFYEKISPDTKKSWR